MSKNVFEWSKAYFRNEDRGLHETKATMAALMTYADFDDLTCYPSQQTLARITGTHVATVRRHIRKNVDAGWLKTLERGSSYKRSSKYVNGGRKLTPFRRLKIDPLVFILRLTIPGLARGRGL